MKTRILILIAACTIISASFTFSLGNESEAHSPKPHSELKTEPIGGFVSEDKF